MGTGTIWIVLFRLFFLIFIFPFRFPFLFLFTSFFYFLAFRCSSVVSLYFSSPSSHEFCQVCRVARSALLDGSRVLAAVAVVRQWIQSPSSTGNGLVFQTG